MFKSIADLEKWLEVTAWDKIYWASVKRMALILNSDGCSGVPDWYVWTCWEHDIHYRTHRLLNGRSTSWEEANYILRRRIQQGSPFKWLSPIAWVRWLGVAVIFKSTSKKAWSNYGK